MNSNFALVGLLARPLATAVFSLVLMSCGGGGSAPAAPPTPSGTGVTVGADVTVPTVAITLPASSGMYIANSSPLVLSGSAADDVGVSQVSWGNDLGGSGTATGTTSWSASGIVLQSGTNTITVTARDAANNTASASIVVIYNTGPQTVYFISPTGNDANSGRDPGAPLRTFANAFSRMSPGDELILLDGQYTTANTGVMHWDPATYSTRSAQPPSGTGIATPTYIHALNPGAVVVNGPLFIGRSNRKDLYIKIQGITFEGGGHIYNGDYITIKESGFHGPFAVGTNGHHMYSDHNLIEDVWIWASGQRVIAINYRSHQNVWRRVVVRGDGCGTLDCTGSGNPNVGITVYDSSDISMQNVIVVDRVLEPGDEPYADFAVAQHTPDARYYFGRNEWLGTMSIKSPDSGYYMEPDAGATLDPTIKISNAVAWDASGTGVNLGRAGTNNLLENLTVKAIRLGFDGIRAASPTTGVVRNSLVAGSGRYGINSIYPPAHVNVFGSASANYNQTTCSANCLTSNPLADGSPSSLKYLPRIEAGSVLKAAGASGADIGANVLLRIGIEGTRYGDAGYNSPTADALWPWPNEDRIKSQMCANTTRGFCSTGKRLDNVNNVTLTSYIWEYLGNPIPSGIYP